LESFAQKKERAIKNLQAFLSTKTFGCRKIYKLPSPEGFGKTEFTYEEILKEMEAETPDGINFIEIWAMDIEEEIEKAKRSTGSSR